VLTTGIVLIHDTVFASASDASIAIAGRKACSSALGKLKDGESVLTSVCDCPPRSGQNKHSNSGFEQALTSLEQEGERIEGTT
jgi:hypothetical protein